MREQVIFSNYVDLALYQSVVELFDLDGVYSFDRHLPNDDVTVDGVLQDLRCPDALTIEQLRAYALAVAGSEFETEPLASRVFTEARKNKDVFLAVAACKFNGGHEKGLMQRFILKNLPDKVEQAIFAVQAFDDETVTVITPLIERITVLLTGDISVFYGNPKMFKFLLDFNGNAPCKSELLTLLNNVVKTAADKSSHAISVLKDYGLRILDVYEMAVYLRTKLDCFSRGYQKTQTLKEYLKEELAQYFRQWTDLDKEFIKRFNGKLESRIYCKQNFSWYHEEYGFSLPELSVNILDDIALDALLEVLTDKERCFVAKYLQLSKKDVRKVGAKFKDWDKELQEYYDSVGPLRTANVCYKLSDLSISEVIEKYGEDSVECYSKLIMFKKLPDAEQYAGLIFKNSLYEFVKFVQRHHIELEDEDLQSKYITMRNASEDVLQSMGNDYDRYQLLKDLGGSLKLLKLCENGFCIKPEWDKDLLHCLLNADSVTLEQVSELMDKHTQGCYSFPRGFDKYYTLNRWDAEGVLYERLMNLSSVKDEKTSFFLKLSKTMDGKYFREWTHLSMRDCLEHWEIANGLLRLYGEAIVAAREDKQYDNVMCDVIHEWVVTGSPFRAMNQKHGLSALLGEKCEYQRPWFGIAEKKVSDAASMSTMDVNYGWVDGVRCWLTPVGLIVDEVNEKLLNSRIPLLGVSDVGELTTVFVGAPINGEVYNNFLHRYFYNDETVKMRLIKW